MKKDLILANDPGAKGAIVLFTDQAKIYKIIQTPSYKEKTTTGKTSNHVDGIEIVRILKPYKDRIKFAILEKVTSMPKQGVKSMFTFGGNFRVIEGILNAWEIPVHFVKPKEWQNFVGYQNINEKDTKAKSRLLAEKHFGLDSFMVDGKSLIKKDGITDASLIGLYGVRKIKG